MIVYHPLDKPLEKKVTEETQDGKDSKVNQATKHPDLIKSIKSLSAQYCAATEEYFRYDPDQKEKFNEMYIQSKMEIIEIGDKELKKAE